MPKCSPLIVTLVPGGPSFGEIPVTTGLLAIGKKTLSESSTK